MHLIIKIKRFMKKYQCFNQNGCISVVDYEWPHDQLNMKNINLTIDAHENMTFWV